VRFDIIRAYSTKVKRIQLKYAVTESWALAVRLQHKNKKPKGIIKTRKQLKTRLSVEKQPLESRPSGRTEIINFVVPSRF